MTQASPEVYTHPINITLTQANHQSHREVTDFIAKSISLAESEAVLTNAMGTTALFINNT